MRRTGLKKTLYSWRHKVEIIRTLEERQVSPKMKSKIVMQRQIKRPQKNLVLPKAPLSPKNYLDGVY